MVIETVKDGNSTKEDNNLDSDLTNDILHKILNYFFVWIQKVWQRKKKKLSKRSWLNSWKRGKNILITRGVYRMKKNNLISPIISVILEVAGSIFKDLNARRKKITIEGEELFNINGDNGLPERVDSLNGLYSNYIYNEITLKSLNKETITSIQLTGINKQPERVSDIRYDGGFNPKLQKYILIAYNNGDIIGNSEKISLEITAEKHATLEKKILKNYQIESQYIKPGDVTSNYILDLSDFYDFFNHNLEYSTLSVNFKTSSGSIFRELLRFDRKTSKFRIDPPILSMAPNQWLPFFNLSGNIKEIELTCAKNISETSQIGFAVYVDESCLLSYRVVLKSKDKVIESDIIHKLHIRIPKYRQEYSKKNGIFYSFVNKINPEFQEFTYSIDDVRNRANDLIFDKEAAAREYSNAKFD